MNLYLQIGSNGFLEMRHNESLGLRPLPGTPTDYYTNHEQDIVEILTAIAEIPYKIDPEFKIPRKGSPVEQNGLYLLGQRKMACSVRDMYICSAQRKDTRNLYTMKILHLKDEVEVITQDDIQGMQMIHNEYLLLSRLRDKDGVYRVHDYFKELYAEEELNANSVLVYSGRIRVRICLVLDYVASIVARPESKYENLQQYVLKKKVLTEIEAAKIFREILLVVKMLHNNNIVHRDLKMSNIWFDKKTLKVTLVNFGLGQYLPSVNTLIIDQRGSPAYISPDILTAEPYAPEPSDMWSLGICLYVMLMGSFPFYDTKLKQLFNKVTKGSYMIPLCGIERLETVKLIKGLLAYNPEVRLKIDDAIALITKIINGLSNVSNEPMQIVPDLESSEVDIKPKESEAYRWKFDFLQRGHRVTLRQDAGCQMPIFHLTSDGQRIKAIEMNYIHNCFTTGIIFDKNAIFSKREPSKIDQVVPEVELEVIQVESVTKVPQLENQTKSKPVGSRKRSLR